MTAYINVSSGCQDATVGLVDQLAADNADLVALEMVDFCSPEGEKRWKDDGLDCMAILFNGSRVVRFPDAGGEMKTAAFMMPAGIEWNHDDLEQAFRAMEDGTLHILTGEEIQRVLRPEPVEVEVSVRDVDRGAELLIDDTLMFTATAEVNGKTPRERAEAAKAVIDEWAQEPVHPSDLQVVSAKGTASIVAKEAEIIAVIEEDAKEAGVEKVKTLARQWLRPLKLIIIDKVREAKEE